MLSAKEKIEAISSIVDRQSATADRILQGYLNDSNIDSDYNNEIRGIAHRMMSLALQQKEERDALFAIIELEPTA